ncbi:MAG: MBOAT family protein [Oscillospiraceae bacterium]|nr:MBOAT family protein [Oscillospiraceae bacterium]
MEFSNLYFLYIFLPLTLAVYFLIPGIKRKNIVLIVASLLFYTMGQPFYLPVLLLTAYGNYWLGDRIYNKDRRTVILPVVLNILVLALFKYLNFFLGIFGIHGSEGGGVVGLALPIGISFYTFQMIAYHVDAYKGKHDPAPSFLNFLLYVSMFPKMLMGPIVRYSEIRQQLESRRSSPRAVFEGGVRFCVGLAKKVLIADYAYLAYAKLEKLPYGAAAWLGALMFMFYIYFEFSGCTDMAIALGRVFGFRYPENFDLPYTSKSITEFWRRWHITLGSFFRDYVYIPLGGNRKGKARQILNLFIVWALTGLWHGANWNYLIWGLYFFALLTAEKQLMPKLEKLPYYARLMITMFFVLIGWVIFSHESLPALGNSFAMMFGKGSFWNEQVGVILRNSLPLIAICLIGSSVLPRWFSLIWGGILVRGRKENQFSATQLIYAISLFLFAALLLYLCTVSLVGNASQPSLYASF